MQRLKIGLIARGLQSRSYGYMIAKVIKSGHLVAVASQDPKDRDYFRYEIGIQQIYTRHQQLLELNELDAIVICAEPDTHAQYLVDTVESGLHVFCTQPMALNQSDGQRVYDAAARRPSQIVVLGFSELYHPTLRGIKKQINETPSTDIQLINVTRHIEEKQNVSYESGGIFFEENLASINLVRYMSQSELSYVQVNALNTGSKRSIESISGFSAHGHLTSGGLYQITTLQSSLDALSIDIHSPTSHINYDLENNYYDVMSGKTLVRQYHNGVLESSELLQLRDFIDHVIEGRKNTLNLSDSIKAVQLAVGFSKAYLFDQKIVF